MALPRGLLFAVLLAVMAASRAQDGCSMSLLTDPVALTESLISSRAVSGVGDGAEPPDNLMVYDQRVVCLVTTQTRDQYRYASVVVVFSCSGATASGSLLGGTCRDGNYTSQFDFECRYSTKTWQESLTPLIGSFGNGSDLNFFIEADANFTTELDTFCSFCIDPGRNIPRNDPILIDQITHCAGKQLIQQF